MASLPRCRLCGQPLEVFESERYCPDCDSYRTAEGEQGGVDLAAEARRGLEPTRDRLQPEGL